MHIQINNKSKKDVTISNNLIVSKGAIMLHISVIPERYKKNIKGNILTITDEDNKKTPELDYEKLNSMKFNELLAYAKKQGLGVQIGTKKNELIKQLKVFLEEEGS